MTDAELAAIKKRFDHYRTHIRRLNKFLPDDFDALFRELTELRSAARDVVEAYRERMNG